MQTRVNLLVVAIVMLFSHAASGQGWSFDARTIGMGGVGGSGNLATKMIDEQRDYTPIVLPIGLIQVLSNTDRFKPSSKDFNPVLDVEYGATPYAYVIGRNPSSHPGEAAFVNDIRNGTVSRDLSKYKGFVPANQILAEGLSSPDFGFTIKVHKSASGGGFQGIYIGVGPYFSMHSLSTISQDLTTVLDTGVNKRNATFPLTEADEAQLALAVTGGYRGRFAWPMGIGSGSDRDGLYVAANYNYLHGFVYTRDNLGVSLLTDNAGLVQDASNIGITHHDATSGTGLAVDFGVGAVIDRWEFGFGARGLANRITWTGVSRQTFTLPSLTSGNGSFVQSPSVAEADTRVELPVDYRGNVGYRGDPWAAAAEVGTGFGGKSFHGGLERRLGQIELRGGARYTLGKWNPTGGIGINFSERVSLDVAAFGTDANIFQTRQTAIAASIRINHMK